MTPRTPGVEDVRCGPGGGTSTPAAGATRTLIVPAPTVWLNSNDRRTAKMAAADIRLWRQGTRMHALSQRFPRGLTRFAIEFTPHLFGPGIAREAPNLSPTYKPALDGLIDYGLAEDDRDRFVASQTVHPIVRHPRDRMGRLGELHITITDLSEETP